MKRWSKGVWDMGFSIRERVLIWGMPCLFAVGIMLGFFLYGVDRERTEGQNVRSVVYMKPVRVGEYKTLYSDDPQELDMFVGEHLREGWEVRGNPQVYGGMLIQAVVK